MSVIIIGKECNWLKELSLTFLILLLAFLPISYADNNACVALTNKVNSSILQKKLSVDLIKDLDSSGCNIAQDKKLSSKLCKSAWQAFTRSNDDDSSAMFFETVSRICQQSGSLDDALNHIETSVFLTQRTESATQLLMRQQYWAELLRSKGDTSRAENVYEQTRKLVGSIDGFQSIFEPALEPKSAVERNSLYKSNIDLYLHKLHSTTLSANEKEVHIEKIINIMEDMKLVSLNNFYSDDCLIRQKRIPPGKREAILYPILVDGSSSTLLLIKHGITEVIKIKTPASSIYQKSEKLLKLLKEHPDFERQADVIENDIQLIGSDLYNIFIRPVSSHLNDIDTLVVIPDIKMGLLPFEAFYDDARNEYSINKGYAISYQPSLSIYSSDSKIQPTSEVKILFAGLTDDKDVGEEIEKEQERIEPFISKSLISSNFTKQNLLHAINNNQVSIIHIASHAQYVSNFKDSYISTYRKEKGMKVVEFEKFVKSAGYNRITPELLILSACETAKGGTDNVNSSFGLAGIAARSGVKSVIASLWKVQNIEAIVGGNDLAHNPNGYLYKLLDSKRHITKAKALQQAKLNMIRSGAPLDRPRNWAAFILIGDWHAMGN